MYNSPSTPPAEPLSAHLSIRGQTRPHQIKSSSAIADSERSVAVSRFCPIPRYNSTSFVSAQISNGKRSRLDYDQDDVSRNSMSAKVCKSWTQLCSRYTLTVNQISSLESSVGHLQAELSTARATAAETHNQLTMMNAARQQERTLLVQRQSQVKEQAQEISRLRSFLDMFQKATHTVMEGKEREIEALKVYLGHCCLLGTHKPCSNSDQVSGSSERV